MGDVFTGKNPKALSEMHEAGTEGFKIGVMMGGGQTIANNVISHYANAKTVKNQNEILDTIIKDEESLNALIEEGKASGEGTVSAKIAVEVEQAKAEGKVTREQVKKLIASNEVYIKEEEKADPLVQAAKEMVNNRSGEATPVKVNEVKKATGFGDSGSVLISKLVNDQGVSFEQAKASVETAYRAGLSGLKSNQVNLRSQIQKLAFEAGKDDKAVQDRAKIEKSKTASVYSTGFTENEYSAKLTPAEREMFTTLSNDLKMDSKMMDKVIAFHVNGKAIEANASHDDGKLRASSTSELPMVSIGLHEGLHRMRQLDPEGTDALMNFLYETSEQNARRMSLGDTGVSLFDQIKAEYGNVKGMEAIDYIEEIAAKRSETIFSSAEAYNEWRAKLDTNPKAKSAWQKFLQVIKEILEDMWASITNSKMSLEAKRQAQRELELFGDAYRNAMKAADQRMQEVTEVKEEATTEGKNEAEAREPKAIDNVGVQVDSKSKSIAPSFSLKNTNLTINSSIPYVVHNGYINVANGDMSALKKLEEKVRNLPRETFTNNATGYRANITSDTIRKAIYPTNNNFNKFEKEHIRNLNAILKLPELFESAVYVDSMPPQKRKNQNLAYKEFHHFVAPISMDNGEYRAIITAREKVNSNTLYVLRVEVLPIYKGHTPSATQQKNAVGSQSLSAPLNVSITELVNGVKIFNYDTNTEKIYTSGDISYSLKDSVDVSSKKTTEYLDAVEDVQKGKKGAAERLAKYVDEGMIRTEAYEQLVEKYGAIPKGEKPHRDVSVPTKTEKNKKVSQTVRTILEAKATPDELVPTVEKMVEDGVFSYDVYTDKEAIEKAVDKLKNEGWIDAYNSWMKEVEQGVVSKELTAQGWALYNNAANRAAEATDETAKRDATQTALSILDAMVRHQRNAAQALQATRILKNLSPETQLYGIQKSVSAFQKELKEKYGKKAPDLKIDEELAEQFIKAKTEEERTKVEKEIFKDIGRQMPSTFMDKWNAWRYLAMLGNPRTHVRNIVGNAFFAPVVIMKDLTATAIESVVAPAVRLSGREMLRGKSIVWGNKNDRALLKAAWSDYANVADMVSNGGKYSDFAMKNQYIEEGRKIFKSKLFAPVEWVRKGNSKALEAEDVWFSKPHYAYALAQYCKANNITAEQIQKGKAIAPAREYAIKEAQKATYKDTNAFSQMVSEWGRNNNEKNVVKKAFNTVVEGGLPFRKTPANILVRGVEYSPLGLLKGLSYDLVQVGKGEMTASQAIDNISAGLTGTGLVALGVYLAAQGLIRGHGEDEEEERKFKEMQGHQSYSLELPSGESITLDWLAPEALPFFVGVNLWEVTEGSKKEANLASILNSVKNISEPMLEMSCLQGLNDLIEGVGNASSEDTSGLMAILSSAVTSYLTQGIPTLFGQAERTSEEERMTTYTEKNDFLTGDLQYTLGKSSAKIPYWDYNQIPYIDAWGRKEASGPALKRGLNNFLNPAYTSTIESSEMEKELLRLYEATGEASVFPERADKWFMADIIRKDLTADEYVRYATLKGQKSYDLVSELVTNEAYKNLTDEEKVKAIRDAYDYANQKAKKAISNYKPEKWVGKADEFGDVDSYIFFRTNVTEVRESNDGSIKKADVVDIIGNTTQDDSEAWDLYLSMYDYPQAHEAEKHGIDANTYMNAVVAMYDIHSDYYLDGKIVDGKDLTAEQRKNLKYVRNSRRRKVEEYLNSVCTSYKDYLFLLGTEYSSITDDADYVSYFGK